MHKPSLQLFDPRTEPTPRACHGNLAPPPTLIVAGSYNQFLSFCREFGLNRGQALVLREHEYLLDFSYIDYMLSGANWENQNFFIPPGHEQSKGKTDLRRFDHRLVDLRINGRTALTC